MIIWKGGIVRIMPVISALLVTEWYFRVSLTCIFAIFCLFSLYSKPLFLISVWNWTQGLGHTRQTLLSLSYIPGLCIRPFDITKNRNVLRLSLDGKDIFQSTHPCGKQICSGSMVRHRGPLFPLLVTLILVIAYFFSDYIAYLLLPLL
jgi:hypothetical protein